MIYVASSWRNEYFLDVVEVLRENKLEIFNFRRPTNAFHWSEIDPGWKLWDIQAFKRNLENQFAKKGFASDNQALDSADSLLLVLPCGKSAHLEAGKAWGQEKPVVIYSPKLEPFEPELMYSFAGLITDTLDEVVDFFLERV